MFFAMLFSGSFFLLMMCNLVHQLSAITMQEFFLRGNLSEIRWDHAVNSKSLLATALANSKHMIEADVIVGHVNDDPQTKVVMGHPPDVRSDLSLHEFLATIRAHNQNPAVQHKKGIKLDFKSTEAYQRTITSDLHLNESFSLFPLWLNGDICKGPGNPSSSGIDMKLKDYVKTKPEFMNSVLWSLGWTTGDFRQENGIQGYTTDHINEMKEMTEGIANITFPVRAMYAAQSITEMKSLLEMGTLTIWSAPQDDSHVNVTGLAKLMKNCLNQIYVDVPEELRCRIFDAIRAL